MATPSILRMYRKYSDTVGFVRKIAENLILLFVPRGVIELVPDPETILRRRPKNFLSRFQAMVGPSNKTFLHTNSRCKVSV